MIKNVGILLGIALLCGGVWSASMPPAAANGGCPKIAVLTGTPGYGKTHVMGRVKAAAGKSIFVFVPQMACAFT